MALEESRTAGQRGGGGRIAGGAAGGAAGGLASGLIGREEANLRLGVRTASERKAAVESS